MKRDSNVPVKEKCLFQAHQSITEMSVTKVKQWTTPHSKDEAFKSMRQDELNLFMHNEMTNHPNITVGYADQTLDESLTKQHISWMDGWRSGPTWSTLNSRFGRKKQFTLCLKPQ